MSPNNVRFRLSNKTLMLRSAALGTRRRSSIFKYSIECWMGGPAACSCALVEDGLDTVLSEAKEKLNKFPMLFQSYDSLCSEST